MFVLKLVGAPHLASISESLKKMMVIDLPVVTVVPPPKCFTAAEEMACPNLSVPLAQKQTNTCEVRAKNSTVMYFFYY